MSTEYEIEGCIGHQTACSVYITTLDGIEVASIRADRLDDEMVARLQRAEGKPLTGEYQGGTLDGQLAF